MPVVSQSIIRPMVPVGASTDACELRTPEVAASSLASSQHSWAALSRCDGTSSSSIWAAASWCWRRTRSMCSWLSS